MRPVESKLGIVGFALDKFVGWFVVAQDDTRNPLAFDLYWSQLDELLMRMPHCLLICVCLRVAGDSTTHLYRRHLHPYRMLIVALKPP